MPGATITLINEITDPGRFERLATAVLRASDAKFASLSHTGVNAQGRTVRSPLDGVGFVAGENPPHVIFVHHTICGPRQLHGKWLHDPATVTSRNPSGPTQPPGDVVKTLEILSQERATRPDLKATLVLTTTQEPSLEVQRDTLALADRYGLSVEIWPGSRLAQFLDTHPEGQWIRRHHLGLAEEMLSPALLRELSAESLSLRPPQGDPDLWIGRELDEILAGPFEKHAVFVVAGSGLGKSVACFKRLKAHLDEGGFGLILPHEAVESAFSIDAAIEFVLRQLRPSLAAGCGAMARSFGSPDKPLLLLIEDINKSGAGAVLLEKITAWGVLRPESAGRPSWVMLCPVWPRLVASLGDEARKRAAAGALTADIFTAAEGARAVQRKQQLEGLRTTELDAASVSASLGHDPLLIALHTPAEQPRPGTVLSRFVEDSLVRVSDRDLTAGEAGDALHALAMGMLKRRMYQPVWRAVTAWSEIGAQHQAALRRVAARRDLFAFTGPSSDEVITFRHDRVRDRILANALERLFRQGDLDDDLLSDPYFAEVIGIAAAGSRLTPNAVHRIQQLDPLALFFSLKEFGEPSTETHRHIVDAITAWLSMEATHSQRNAVCRWNALLVLFEVKSSLVLAISRRFRNQGWALHRVLCREGDLIGAINTCLVAEPGIRMSGAEGLFEHVRTEHGAALSDGLRAIFAQPNVDAAAIRGGLYLAGHLGDPGLAPAIASCWSRDSRRLEHLDGYLWAGAHCSGDNPELVLGPVCDAWAALPDKDENGISSRRHDLAAHHIKWAFREGLPEPVLHYFIRRAEQTELRWPIVYMLNGVDHPDAVEFIARERAEHARRGGTVFSMFFDEEWLRQEEKGRKGMSPATKARLLRLWQNDLDDHLRRAAFRLWACSRKPEDLHTLQALVPDDPLYEKGLWQRLRWGDVSAVPGMIEKLRVPDDWLWWQLGRYVWSDDLTGALDDALRTRREGKERDMDWMLSELLQERPQSEAERLLIRNWESLKTGSHYILAALYIATPVTCQMAAAAVEAYPDKSKLFEFVLSRFGHRTQGRRGFYRLEQMEAIRPYLGYLKEHEISELREICRERGWTEFEREHIDATFPPDAREIAFHDQDTLFRELDEMSQKHPFGWIDHWLDRFVETGASLDTIFVKIGEWLAARGGPREVRLASAALLHRGRRAHLSILESVMIDPADAITEIVANTRFGVMRRSIN